jgi:hypothetical protein
MISPPGEGGRPRGVIDQPWHNRDDRWPKNEQKTGEKSSAWWSMAVAAWKQKAGGQGRERRGSRLYIIKYSFCYLCLLYRPNIAYE